jgi:hypothetical protein
MILQTLILALIASEGIVEMPVPSEQADKRVAATIIVRHGPLYLSYSDCHPNLAYTLKSEFNVIATFAEVDTVKDIEIVVTSGKADVVAIRKYILWYDTLEESWEC